jgi:hypothetical protein
MPALVLAAELAIYPHRSPIVHRAEVQQNPPPMPFVGQQEYAPIPYIRMETAIPDAALRTLETKRNRYGPAEILGAKRPELLQPDIFIVEFEVPGAVQVHPLFAPKLRLWIFRTGQRLVNVVGRKR